jgi:hypothetical protein
MVICTFLKIVWVGKEPSYNKSMPKTDYERFIDERAAAAHLRDSMFRLLGRMEHQLFTDRLNGMPEEWLRDRMTGLQKALDEHAAQRDQGLGEFQGTSI